MGVEQVHAVGAQPAQAGLAAGDDVPPREAHVVGIVAHATADFGGQHDVVAPILQRLAGDLFRVAANVDIGGIYKVAAGVEELVDHTDGGRFVGATGVVAKDHRAQAQLGDDQATAA